MVEVKKTEIREKFLVRVVTTNNKIQIKVMKYASRRRNKNMKKQK
jgi:hypothetical protein